MTMRMVYACDTCGRMEETDSDIARGWLLLLKPRKGVGSIRDDRHFCGYGCLEMFARREGDPANQERSHHDLEREPGATQPGTRRFLPRKVRPPLFRPSAGLHGNADELPDELPATTTMTAEAEGK